MPLGGKQNGTVFWGARYSGAGIRGFKVHQKRRGNESINGDTVFRGPVLFLLHVRNVLLAQDSLN